MLTQFDDGSAIVKGDGSPAEREALLQLLRGQGTDEPAALGIAETLLSQGLTLSVFALSDDPRTMGEGTFRAITDALGESS